MKILWISHTSTLFGAERCLLEFLQATKDIHENYMILPEQGRLEGLARPMVKETYIIPTDWWASPKTPTLKRWLIKYFYIVSSILKLTKYIARIKPDVVISNSIVTVHGAVAAKLKGIPHMYYIHEYVEEDHNYSFDFGIKAACLIANWTSDLFLVNAVGVKQKFAKYLPSDKLKMLYYIINVSPGNYTRSLKKHIMEIILPGRVEENKGQLQAVEAMGLLKNKNIDVHLTIIGMGPSEYALRIRDYVAKNQLEELVSLVDFCEDPLVFFVNADICLSTSKKEAFGRTTIEAMKFGVPVIGTSAGETIYLIQEGKTGYFFEYGRPDQLAAKIELSYNNPLELEKLKLNARKFAESLFDEHVFNKSFNLLLEEVI